MKTDVASGSGGTARPLDEDILQLVDRLWAALGVARDDVAIADYRYHRPRTWCDELAPDDRWIGERRSGVAAGSADPAAAEHALSAFLAGEGFTVRRCHSTHPDDRSRALEAVRDGGHVFAYLGPGSPIDVVVRLGPCAPVFGYLDPDRYAPDPVLPDA